MGSLFFLLLASTAFAGDVRISACEFFLQAMASSTNAKTPSEHKLADAYRDLYSSLVEAIDEPVQALRLEHVPASTTLSKAAKKRIRRAPQPVLQSLRLVNAASFEKPYVGEILYRVDRSEADGVPTLSVESIGIHSSYSDPLLKATIERAALARALFENPDVKHVKLRVSEESMTALDRKLTALDPRLELAPNFAARLSEAGPNKTRRNVQTAARLKEMFSTAAGHDIARAALAEIDEFFLARDMSFGKILQVGSGPEIQTLEIVFGFAPQLSASDARN